MLWAPTVRLEKVPRGKGTGDRISGSAKTSFTESHCKHVLSNDCASGSG